jgi:folate-binding protein YgfZ
MTIIRLPGHQPRFMVIGDFSAISPLWESLESTTRTVGSDAWDLHDIYVAIPHISANTVDAFVPQMVNLHAIDGISFTKGCYTGQEVVARMRYLGKLKRRMYRGHIATDIAPAPGDSLFSSSSQSGQGAGRIVTALPAPEGGYAVLAVIEISAAETDSIRWQSVDGTELTLASIPYEVPLDKNG